MQAAMDDRKSFDTMLWLISSLTLLTIVALVLVALIQSRGSVAVSPLSDCLQGNFAQRTVESTILRNALLAPDAVLKGQALASVGEDEEPRGEAALDAYQVSFLMYWSFRKAPDCRSIAIRSVLSLYQLRC